jgi:hypothetical protein
MKKLKLLLLVPALMSVQACKHMTDVPTSGPVVIARHSVIDDRAMLTAELSFKATDIIVNGLINSGMLSLPQIGIAKNILKSAATSLYIARDAYKAFNSAGLELAVKQLQALEKHAHQLRSETNV